MPPATTACWSCASSACARTPRTARWRAALLGQLGDPRAVEPLRAQLDSADLNYFTYREIRFAIEELGEDAGPERDFSGDPDYEALRNL